MKEGGKLMIKEEIIEVLKKVAHELSSTHGLYATDRKEWTNEHHFMLENKDLNNEVNALITKLSDSDIFQSSLPKGRIHATEEQLKSIEGAV